LRKDVGCLKQSINQGNRWQCFSGCDFTGILTEREI
jgi:hypothetical protein